MEENKYIGPNKITASIVQDFKTPSGDEIIKVVYEGNVFPELIPKKLYENLVKDEPTDYTLLRENRYKDLILKISELCLENNVDYGDLKYVMTSVADKLQDAFERASSYLWTGDDKQWIPGIQFLQNRSLLEAEQILRKIKEENGGN